MSNSTILGAAAGLVILGLAVNIIIPRAEAEGFNPTRVEKVLHADGTTCYIAMGPKGIPRAMDCK
jgi:hypothetical protein